MNDGRIVVLHTRVVRGSGGGPDKTILNSPRFLDGSRYRAVCAYMHPPGDPDFEKLADKARSLGAPLISVGDRGSWDWQVIPRLLEVCRRERVAIWHGHDYKSNLLGLLLRRRWPMRLVTTVHGWGVRGSRRTRVYYGVDRLCLRHYERVVCVSEDLRRECLSLGVTEPRCVLVENAIDLRQFSRTRSVTEAKARLGVGPGRLVIGAVGRLSTEKGFDLLIRAADRLLDEGVDLELWIVGEGDRGPHLADLVRALGRGDRIRLMGFRSDTVEIYEAMDAFALSSYHEGLPNVVLEAMAMGVPVVSTRIAGIPRLIRHGENGLLVEPGDGRGLADALRHLLTDIGLSTRVRDEARRTIEERCSFDARMRKIIAIYDDLLGTDRNLHPPAQPDDAGQAGGRPASEREGVREVRNSRDLRRA